MYVVIGATASRAFRVLWLLEELGLEYEHRPEAPHSAAVRALDSSGKIPILLVDGVVMTDSLAIMTFLADRHGALTYPAGTVERGLQDALTLRILDEIEAVIWMAARHSFVLPVEKRVPEVLDSLRWEFGRGVARIAERLGDGPFLMGAEMTVPDILLAHCGRWAARANFEIESPGLNAFLARMWERSAFKRVIDG